MCVLIFSKTFVLKFLILRRIAPDNMSNIYWECDSSYI